MSYHTFQHYVFDTNLSSESLVPDQTDPALILQDMQYQLQSRQISHSSNFSPSIFPTLPDIP